MVHRDPSGILKGGRGTTGNVVVAVCNGRIGRIASTHHPSSSPLAREQITRTHVDLRLPHVWSCYSEMLSVHKTVRPTPDPQTVLMNSGLFHFHSTWSLFISKYRSTRSLGPQPAGKALALQASSARGINVEFLSSPRPVAPEAGETSEVHPDGCGSTAPGGMTDWRQVVSRRVNGWIMLDS